MPETCTPGLDYCGWKLLELGSYYDRITAQIRAHNHLVDEAHVQSSLFHCTGADDNNGTIRFKEFCGETRCQDSKSEGKSDHCWTPNAAVEIPTSSSSTPSAAAVSALVASISSTPMAMSTTLSTVINIATTTPQPNSSLHPTSTPNQVVAPRPGSARAMSHAKYIAMAAGVGVGVTAVVLLSAVAGFFLLKRRRAREVRETTGRRGVGARAGMGMGRGGRGEGRGSSSLGILGEGEKGGV